MAQERPSIGAAGPRVEAWDKVTGRAPYAVDHPVPGAAYAWVVQSTVARGIVVDVDTSRALAEDGVLAVLWHGNAPHLEPVGEPELLVLQSPRVSYRGQVVAVVVATSPEAARAGAGLVRVREDGTIADTVLRMDHPALYQPVQVNAGYPARSAIGDLDAGLAAAAVRVDATYRTPAEHHCAMEPHATTAFWERGCLVVFDATQASTAVHESLAGLFELPPQSVRVVNEHVGGGFGGKGGPRANVVLAAMAARLVGRPVKLALTRQQLFALAGYRTPTIQRVRLGATPNGRLLAVGHDAVSQTSQLTEFVEQTAVLTRHMYAAPHRLTTHRVVALDVPTPGWMRAPGECPGSFALESAIDELAVAGNWDPVRLRIDNEPPVHPEEQIPFSSRHLVQCLELGAQRFDWAHRDPRPAVRRDGEWLIGTGVAASTYPALTWPSTALARATADQRFDVEVNAADIGTGARTVLRQIAADALDVPLHEVEITVGDSAIGPAPVAGGSTGTASWGWAVTKACRMLREQIDREHGGRVPAGGVAVRADTTLEIRDRPVFARHAYGAQFCQVRVSSVTGEVRVDRLLGVFAAGRIVNPTTARSQLLGGMTMGLSGALLEQSVLDSRTGDFVTGDLAAYHVAVNADVPRVEVEWLDEHDPHLNPMGVKGIGELGIVGTAAAVANAVYHATGIRVRDLPIGLERLITRYRS
ncbi:xanthine dehydrogenase family protein molybdopterin-binding subunit [Dactylosporangium aurantiacum]|uniref:Xanthine dehydrogenase family protein molybdopterin-binding subunit n=1 Tax=Dactylosporangium aurantiacum TaxID=35754 RepID=A0A9Q9IVC8_9ACTN|nr:xanthine dehydrogenase family protein molybdopterin-binding subunit [Dactylosporangium aurantiacum]